MKAGGLAVAASALALLTTSCGGDSTTPERAASGGANSTVTSARVVTPAFEDRSLVSLLSAAERLSEGRFQVIAPDDVEGTHLAPNAQGWFWTTELGIYTRVDIDRDVVDSHVDDVLARPSRETIDPAASDLIDLRDDYYRGDEFQFGIGHLMVRLGFASPNSHIEDPFGEECGVALEALEAAFIERAAALEPAFVAAGNREVWEFPLDELSSGIAADQARVDDACAAAPDDDGSVPTPRLRFERSGDRLEVIVDPGVYTEPVDVVALTVLVESAVEIPDPPAEPDPADGFDPVNVFIMKISECGTLPWEYSNFAAGNTYSSPDADDYLGPTFFVSDYLCESELPDDLR